MIKFALVAGAFNAMLAVMIGAFGAHGLKNRVDADMLAVYQTGATYHMTHALALIAVGLLMLHLRDSAALAWSARFFLAGIVLFSGSLYLLSLSGIRWLGAITPLGGVCFIVAWALLAWACYKGTFNV